jgi:hypothetical protein
VAVVVVVDELVATASEASFHLAQCPMPPTCAHEQTR